MQRLLPWDKPSFMVVNNKQMIEWADQLSQDHSIALPRHLQRPERLRRYEKAIASAAALADDDLPEKSVRPAAKKMPPLSVLWMPSSKNAMPPPPRSTSTLRC